MGLQDLTPQLRTRLSRVERAVGLFVTLATLLLVSGFFYYLFHTAQRKGWFKTEIRYSTGLNNAAGLKEGDPVTLMGFTVGTLTRIEANDPGDPSYGVTVFFEIIEPYYGYIWLDSKVRVAPADLLGKRNLEVVKGRIGVPTVIGKEETTLGVLDASAVKQKATQLRKSWAERRAAVLEENPGFTPHAVDSELEQLLFQELNEAIRAQREFFYTKAMNAEPFWIAPLESPALTERLETLVSGVEGALPNILNLTNQLAAVLDNAAEATTRLDQLLITTRPLVTNLTDITGNLRDPKGSLGEWLLPTNLQAQLVHTLDTADTTLSSTDSNLTALVISLNQTLENLASITSNLNQQVEANTNILKNVSEAVVHSDELVQGLKRHWLLRSAFKKDKKKDD